ncbi:ABC transporter ATP-binding protein [Lysinibacillus sp. 54212]|uniref:ABC transporter ATP-binding protein n=1 Tax=Lysinibacillus sp. 54212 TaxID=3119829 RepID=UPI002FC72CD8
MICCEQVVKKYRKKYALHNISFQIEEPKIIALIGRNGAGKSTLMKLLAGHQKPTGGTIEVLGEKPFNSLYVSTNTIYTEEHMAFSSSFTVSQILQQGKLFYQNWQGELAERLLAYANIPLKSHPKELSKGQYATLLLVFALSTRCAVTLLDEPMNGMGEAIRTDFYRAILKEYIAHPRLIMISSHYLAEMEHLIEDVLLIKRGVVELYNSLDAVQTMAVKIRGEKSVILEHVKEAGILAQRDGAPFYEAIVEASMVNLAALSSRGVQVLPVSASEICRVLTSDGEGGIDDVFQSYDSLV